MRHIHCMFAVFALLLMGSCAHHKSLEEQLNESFANHLEKLDSSAKLDSVHILWNAKVTERLGRIIDDSVYIREFARVQAQLSAALPKNNMDTIVFYRYEINYMEKQIDSVTKSIPQGDTTHRYGFLINCAYYITRNQKTKMDSTLIFVDSTSTMRYTEYMDSAIGKTVRTMK
jgi:predicted phosphohydrolase